MPTDHYKIGETIFEEGYPADGVYLICSGKVQINKSRAGKDIILATLGEGKIFGEMAFIDSRPRSATVIAVEDTWCYKHNKDVFLEKIKNLDPIVARVFQDLVGVVREKSKAQVLIDHSKIHPLSDADIKDHLNIDVTTTTPSRSKADLLSDKKIQEKISEMDLFMRTLFDSLVEIAYM